MADGRRQIWVLGSYAQNRDGDTCVLARQIHAAYGERFRVRSAARIDWPKLLKQAGVARDDYEGLARWVVSQGHIIVPVLFPGNLLARGVCTFVEAALPQGRARVWIEEALKLRRIEAVELMPNREEHGGWKCAWARAVFEGDGLAGSVPHEVQ